MEKFITCKFVSPLTGANLRLIPVRGLKRFGVLMLRCPIGTTGRKENNMLTRSDLINRLLRDIPDNRRTAYNAGRGYYFLPRPDKKTGLILTISDISQHDIRIDESIYPWQWVTDCWESAELIPEPVTEKVYIETLQKRIRLWHNGVMKNIGLANKYMNLCNYRNALLYQSVKRRPWPYFFAEEQNGIVLPYCLVMPIRYIAGNEGGSSND